MGLRNRGILILLGAVAIVYSPTLFNGFVYDEHSLLLPISAYWTGDVLSVLTSPANGFEYQPVRDLSVMLDAWLWGRNPLGFHLSSLAYYLILIWIMYHTVLKLAALFASEHPGHIAWLTALIFAFHPINSEVVYFISARNNIFAMMFVLISLSMYIDKRWFASVLVFILALLSKASVVYFPLVLALICITWPVQDNRRTRAHWATLAVIFCLNLAAIALHLQIGVAEGTVQPNMSRPGVLDLSMTFQRALLVPAYYLYRFLMPWPLNVFLNDGWIYNFSALWISGLLLCGYMTSLWAAWRYRVYSVLPLVGLVWFYAALGPVSNLFPTHPMFAERYMFQCLFGLSLGLASVLVRADRRNGVLVLVGIVVMAWSVMVFHRGQDWKTDQSLYGAAFRAAPTIAAYPYVVSLLEVGDHATVETLLREEKLPEFLVEMARGELASNRTDYTSAQAHLDKALALGVDQTDLVLGRIHFMLASNLESLGRYEEAMGYYLKVIDASMFWSDRFYGKQASARIDILRTHTFGERQSRLEAAAIAYPTDVRAQAEFGLHLLRMGEYPQAVYRLQRAGQLEQNSFGIQYNLGLALLKQGDQEAALLAFQRADVIAPSQSQVQNHLALLYAGRGDHERAITLWRSILNREQDNFKARYNLARLYIRLGKSQLALELLRQGARSTDSELAERYRMILDNLPAGFE